MIETENHARMRTEQLLLEAERQRLARELTRARRRARRIARSWAGGKGRGGDPHRAPSRWQRPLRTG
ncbi:hypothetical protein [Streptomyces murinus]|uniref:hypothetical protein n=1 Tax=Streptomyces murinus TaxID=33900 RepID=UPI0018F54D5D|nr:hypothetical protein [Streptomyces murinus]